jgi:NitT/TauT family transport system substrate-binding protein
MPGKQTLFLPALCIALALIIVLFLAPDVGLIPKTSQQPTVYLLYSTAGSMPQLLTTDQIDGFFVWQPYVAMARQGGMGKILTYSEDLPPNHYWADQPCCVLVMSNRFIVQNPEQARMLSLLTTAGIQYVNDYPDQSEQYTAGWIFGSGDLLIAGKYLDPLTIEQESFPTLHFVNESSLPQSYNRSLTQNLTVAAPGLTIPGSFSTLATGGTQVSPSVELPLIRFGYLATDHDAPLFVLAADPDFFHDNYGLALNPVYPEYERPTLFNLVSGNTTVAKVQLIPEQSGGGLMTIMGQGAIEVAYVGSTPANLQIGFGNPAQVIQPLHTGGSALVVANTSPCNDWQDFTVLARQSSSAGNPLIIATVQSSIQETMIREALETDGFEVRLYGT